MEIHLVSVVVPVFNAAEFLEKCLASLACQTYVNLQIICVNDGSTDSSSEIISAFCNRDSRFSCIETQNRGLSMARNEGITRATGDWILFVDSDDAVVPTAVEQLLKLSKSGSDDIIFFQSRRLGSHDNPCNEPRNFGPDYSEWSSFPSGLDALSAFASENLWKPSACLQLIRHDFIKNNQLQFEPGILHEDNLFTLQALRVAGPVTVYQTPLYLVRHNPRSITRRQKTARHVIGLLEAHSKGNEILATSSDLAQPHRAGIRFVLNHIIHQARGAYRKIPQADRESSDRAISELVNGLHKKTRLGFALLTLPLIGNIAFGISRLRRHLMRRATRVSGRS